MLWPTLRGGAVKAVVARVDSLLVLEISFGIANMEPTTDRSIEVRADCNVTALIRGNAQSRGCVPEQNPTALAGSA